MLGATRVHRSPYLFPSRFRAARPRKTGLQVGAGGGAALPAVLAVSIGRPVWALSPPLLPPSSRTSNCELFKDERGRGAKLATGVSS